MAKLGASLFLILSITSTSLQAQEQPAQPMPKLPTVLTEVTVSPEETDASAPARVPIGKALIEKLPTESISSPLASLLTLTTPGVSADSNGSFHPLGDHAEVSFYLDGEPITDQQGRTFSSPIPLGAISSLETLIGAPGPDIGDKTSMVVVATTRSGMDTQKPTGSVSVHGGSFGTYTTVATLGFTRRQWGNFTTMEQLNSGRFLDTPELEPLHAGGNSLNVLEHVDYRINPDTLLQWNAGLSRTRFETPNTYVQQALGQDQAQTVESVNLAPSAQHTFTSQTLAQINLWVRQDTVTYLPSADILADTPATLSQHRTLRNAGIRTTWTLKRGRHLLKLGGDWRHTFLQEEFAAGLTDAAYNSPCLLSDGSASPDTSLHTPADCSAHGLQANPGFLPGLLQLDLSRGGSLFQFHGATDIKQEALYAQDAIRLGDLTFNLGLRAEKYNGLTTGGAVQPRIGAAYRFKPGNTVVRAAYSRILLTPYNENLIVAGANGPGSTAALGAATTPLHTGNRNQFNLGTEASINRVLSVSAEWFWKFSYGAYDFDVLLNSPLAFPTQFRKSKIDGGMLRLTLHETKKWNGYATVSHVRSRLFGPAIGGISFSAPYGDVVRPDHDEGLAMNLYLQKQFGRRGPWVAVTYRYDGGLVAVAVPDTASALRLSGDEQTQMGFYCGSTHATIAQPIRNCHGAMGSTRIRIPAAGTENDDRNPSRIAVRNILDLSFGKDDLWTHDRMRLGASIAVTNLGNVDGLYNFLSTFAGTHFLAPRTVQAGIRCNF